MIKALSLYFGRPLNCTWNEVGPLLNQLQDAVAKAFNHCMTTRWLWQKAQEDWRKEHGEYPRIAEVQLKNELYRSLRAMYPEFHSQIFNQVAHLASKKWKADCKNVFYRMEKSLPSYRKSQPIPIVPAQFGIELTDSGYVLSIGLLPRGNKRFEFTLKTKDLKWGQRTILERIVAGTYKKCASQVLKDRHGKWLIQVSYEFEPVRPQLDPNRIVGVDLGIRNAFYCGLSDGHDRLCPCDSNQLQGVRQQIRRRCRDYQRHYRTLQVRKGKGRAHALEPLSQLSEKERRFREDKCHQYSRAIIDFAVKHGAGIIQMEDLDSLKESKQASFILSSWPISDLQNKIRYKAEEVGVEVRFVAARFTSQRCYKCGHIEEGNRRDERFSCLSCGHEADADYNAAQNLSLPDIEELIAQELLRLPQQDQTLQFEEADHSPGAMARPVTEKVAAEPVLTGMCMQYAP